MDDLIATTPSVSEHDALRADIYRLLARLLLAPPDAELLDFLAGLEADDEDPEMAASWRGLAAAAAATTPDRAARDHFALLVGVIQGEITPYASWYLHGTLMDEPLVALRRDLRRLGLARTEASRDPEDHLGALCEAMALLAARDDPEPATWPPGQTVAWPNWQPARRPSTLRQDGWASAFWPESTTTSDNQQDHRPSPPRRTPCPAPMIHAAAASCAPWGPAEPWPAPPPWSAMDLSFIITISVFVEK